MTADSTIPSLPYSGMYPFSNSTRIYINTVASCVFFTYLYLGLVDFLLPFYIDLILKYKSLYMHARDSLFKSVCMPTINRF